MNLRFSALPSDKLTWLVVAYGQLRVSIKTPDAPYVDVQIISQETGDQRIVQVGLYDLLEIPVGSYWVAQRRVRHPAQNQVETRKFTLEVLGFDEAQFKSAYERDGFAEECAWQVALERAREQGSELPKRKPKRYLIPPNVLKVHKECAATQYLYEEADCGTQLFIPCLSIFLRTYGASKNFKEIFLNNEREAALTKMCFAIDESVLENSPEHDEFAIGLTKDLTDDDTAFIYYLLESLYFERVHKSIRHQLNMHLKHGVFLRVPMWFKGTMSLEVRGVAYTSALGEERFLVHDILGMSYPLLPKFFLDRKNTNLTNDDGDNEGAKPPGWGGANGKPNNGEEEDRNSKKPPGQNAGLVSFDASTIKILGDAPRMRKAIRKSKVTEGNGENKSPGVGFDSTSTSAPFSDDDKVAKAREQHQPKQSEDQEKPTPKSERFAKDVIGLLGNALKSLKASNVIKDFQFISKTGGSYQVTDDLQVLEFKARGDRVWSYHGSDVADPRVMAIAKLKWGNGRVLFACEIQPRINRNGNSDGNLKGCVFFGPKSGLTPSTLGKMMEELIKHKGVWSKVPTEITGSSYSYRHVGTPTEEMMVRSLKAAIAKLPGMKPEKKKRKKKLQKKQEEKTSAD